jgi:hypothetical protein
MRLRRIGELVVRLTLDVSSAKAILVVLDARHRGI